MTDQGAPGAPLDELIEKWRSEADDKEASVRQLRLERQDLPANFFNYRLDEARILRRVADELAADCARLRDALAGQNVEPNCRFMRVVQPSQDRPCSQLRPDDEMQWCGACLLAKYAELGSSS